MNVDPQTTEIRKLVEQTHEMVIQIAKEQTRCAASKQKLTSGLHHWKIA